MLKEAPNGGVYVSIYRPERELIGRTYDYVMVSEGLLRSRTRVWWWIESRPHKAVTFRVV